jgi:hypothetical protein
MERLTNKREADAQREEYERRLANGYPRNIPEERFLRLAAYEDTWLTPQEVSTLTKDWSDLCTIIGECGGLDRVKALAEADKDGRLVMLPCKVGDFVYGFHNGKTILPMVAKWFETNYDGWSVAVQHVPMAPRFYRFSDFGKTAFLTREEAEKALEAMKDGNS